MARFGSNINPSLGAVNYTPYMQGALAGSQSIAQGIATLGQAATSSIKDYYAKKEEEKKKDEAANSFIKIVEANPSAFQAYLKDGKIDKDAVKAMVNNLGSLGTMQLGTYISEATKQDKAEKIKTEGAKYADYLTQTQGEDNTDVPFMNDLRSFQESRFSPEAKLAGRQINLGARKTEAEIGALEARAGEAARAENAALRKSQQISSLVKIANSSPDFASYMKGVEQSGLSSENAADIYKKITEARALSSKPEDVRTSVVNVDLGNGNTKSLVMASVPGKGVQVLSAGNEDPAEVRVTKSKQDLLKKAEDAYNAGNRSEALRLLRSGGFKTEFNYPITDFNLDDYFPKKSSGYTVEVE